jgi:hypothetical protein
MWDTSLFTNVFENGLFFSSITGGIQLCSDKSTYWPTMKWMASNWSIYLPSAYNLQNLQPIGSQGWYLKKLSRPG